MGKGVQINIQKKDLWILSAVIAFLVGVGFVIGFGDYSGNEAQINGHSSDEVMVNVSGELVSLQEFIDEEVVDSKIWASDWIAVVNKKVYYNGDVDEAGNIIDLNHNLGTSEVVTQIFYAPDAGTFPSSPLGGKKSAVVGHSDSNIDWRSVHSGILLQNVQANQIGKFITGHESVGIWDDGDSDWNDFRKDEGWIKIILMR